MAWLIVAAPEAPPRLGASREENGSSSRDEEEKAGDGTITKALKCIRKDSRNQSGPCRIHGATPFPVQRKRAGEGEGERGDCTAAADIASRTAAPPDLVLAAALTRAGAVAAGKRRERSEDTVSGMETCAHSYTASRAVAKPLPTASNGILASSALVSTMLSCTHTPSTDFSFVQLSLHALVAHACVHHFRSLSLAQKRWHQTLQRLRQPPSPLTPVPRRFASIALHHLSPCSHRLRAPPCVLTTDTPHPPVPHSNALLHDYRTRESHNKHGTRWHAPPAIACTSSGTKVLCPTELRLFTISCTYGHRSASRPPQSLPHTHAPPFSRGTLLTPFRPSSFRPPTTISFPSCRSAHTLFPFFCSLRVCICACVCVPVRLSVPVVTLPLLSLCCCFAAPDHVPAVESLLRFLSAHIPCSFVLAIPARRGSR